MSSTTPEVEPRAEEEMPSALEGAGICLQMAGGCLGVSLILGNTRKDGLFSVDWLDGRHRQFKRVATRSETR